MVNDIVKKEDVQIIPIAEADVPAIIQNQFTKMQDAKDELALAQDKAQLAQNLAYVSKDSKTGLFKNKQAIENLQDVAVELADAQLKATEAQAKAFEYQQTLAEITKYLFGLGVTNIAMNRCVVKELEMRLDQASEEEIDEATALEITNVVKQLKAQEDLILKQDKLMQALHDEEQKVSELSTKNKLLEDKVVTLEEKNLRNTERIRDLVEENHKKRFLFPIVIGLSIAVVLAIILAIIGIAV